MSFILLQLSLGVLAVIQLTSSQFTYDVIQQENDVNSCGRTEEVLHKLMTAMSQLRQNDVSSCGRTDQVLNQLATAVSQLQQNDFSSGSRIELMMNELMRNNSQLQTTVSELQTALSQLQTSNLRLMRDVAAMKAAVMHHNEGLGLTGELRN